MLWTFQIHSRSGAVVALLEHKRGPGLSVDPPRGLSSGSSPMVLPGQPQPLDLEVTLCNIEVSGGLFTFVSPLVGITIETKSSNSCLTVIPLHGPCGSGTLSQFRRADHGDSPKTYIEREGVGLRERLNATEDRGTLAPCIDHSQTQ